MIRIIFDNGELMECEHINKIYIDKEDADKVVVRELAYMEMAEESNELLSYMGRRKAGEEIWMES